MPNLQDIADDPDKLKASVDRMMSMGRDAAQLLENSDDLANAPKLPLPVALGRLVFAALDHPDKEVRQAAATVPLLVQDGSWVVALPGAELARAENLRKVGELAAMGVRYGIAKARATAAEEALSDVFTAVCGRPPEWSNYFDYADAVEEIGEHLLYLKAAEALINEADAAINPRDRENHHVAWAASLIFGIGFSALRGDALATCILLIFTLWHLLRAAWFSADVDVEVGAA